MANPIKRICPICKIPIDPGDVNVLNLGSVSLHDVCAASFAKKKSKPEKQDQPFEEDPWDEQQ